jgi:hypothetical protein
MHTAMTSQAEHPRPPGVEREGEQLVESGVAVDRAALVQVSGDLQRLLFAPLAALGRRRAY